jgi:hydrogenase/urease accessory protein HupE
MKRLALFFAVFFAVLCVLLAQPARSDELRPGYLELRQTSPDTYSLLFKIPARGEDLRLAIYVQLPEGTQDVGLPRASFSDGAYVERRSIRRDGGLAGQAVSIEGLSATSTDVLVRVESLEGAIQTERLAPTKTSFVIQAVPGSGEVAAAYLRLGVEHILFGFDHLLFVLALVILVRDWRRVAITVTAFTIAHSITLAGATLGFVNVPGPPVEATIALSIMLVSVEILNARRGKPSLTARLPWLVAFSFGLLHGFGFAGALAEVGLPQHAIPVALLFFNLGVEIGQLAFVAAVLTASGLFRTAMTLRLEPTLIQQTVNRIDVLAAYAIGAVAAFWLIERTSAFFV